MVLRLFRNGMYCDCMSNVSDFLRGFSKDNDIFYFQSNLVENKVSALKQVTNTLSTYKFYRICFKI